MSDLLKYFINYTIYTMSSFGSLAGISCQFEHCFLFLFIISTSKVSLLSVEHCFIPFNITGIMILKKKLSFIKQC